MKCYCPLCNRTGEVDEVELAQFEREVNLKFLEKVVTFVDFGSYIKEILEKELEEGN